MQRQIDAYQVPENIDKAVQGSAVNAVRALTPKDGESSEQAAEIPAEQEEAKAE